MQTINLVINKMRIKNKRSNKRLKMLKLIKNNKTIKKIHKTTLLIKKPNNRKILKSKVKKNNKLNQIKKFPKVKIHPMMTMFSCLWFRIERRKTMITKIKTKVKIKNIQNKNKKLLK